ncbi:recombinase RecT [Ensifer sp. PDNC004]|uniref:recombinase RecT n=1 Tax=Ensifer sp. PDNC004 TaxID=2811423 RepID=UPI001963BF86|nr:recombinase RecT [Ensifer sp. PDNC004]QRY69211.1 recombinase RecT [Ensifer sp. PDNC004]
MNQLATSQERLPMDSVGISSTGTGAKIAPQNLAEVVKFAEVMCRADIALPKHLRGNAGACMAVALQAMEWELSPFAVASKSYAVNGAIAYEAQLIAAVVNTRSGIKGRLKYRYDGTGGEMTCTVTGILDGDECEYTTPPIGSITVKNSPLWKSDPQQQLGYFAARSWARRHCPEVILGVYDRDEAEQFRGPDNAKDVTPPESPVMARLRANSATQEPQDEQEGFSRSFVAEQTDEPHDALTGEIIEPNTGEDTPAPPVNDAASATAASEGDGLAAQQPSPSNLWLLNVARMLVAATNYGGDVSVLKAQKHAAIESYPKPDDCPAIISGKAEAVYAYCKQIVEGSLEPGDGLAVVAGVVGCDQDDLKRKGE